MRIHKLLTVLVSAGVISVNTMTLLLTIYHHKLNKQQSEIKEFYKNTSSLLLVIAHPDDEALFFVPSFESLNIPGIQNYLLCISNGNSDGKGHLREKELENSCKILRIEHHKVLHDPNLQDSKKNEWDPNLIAQHVADYVKEHNIENVTS